MASVTSFATTCEERIKAAPLQSAGIGLAAGYLLTRRPTLFLFGLILRVAFMLVRPALLVFGLTKVWEISRRAKADQSQAQPENHF